MTSENTASLDTRLEQLRTNLARQASQTRIASILTLLVGVLALGAFGFYFYWGYTQFSEVVQHERVADTVVTMVDDNLPGIRKSIDEEVRKDAPVWAEGLSKQLRDSLPSGRQKLEDYVIDRANAELAKGTVLTQEQFTKFLRENKAALRKDIVELSKNPNLAETAIADLEKALEAQLNADLKSNSREMLYVLAAFGDKLGKLSKSRDLDQTETIERRLAMIARALQSQQVAPTEPAATSAASTVVPASAAKKTEHATAIARSAPVPTPTKDTQGPPEAKKAAAPAPPEVKKASAPTEAKKASAPPEAKKASPPPEAKKADVPPASKEPKK